MAKRKTKAKPKPRTKSRRYSLGTVPRGQPPGTPVFVGKEWGEPVRVTLFDFDEKHLAEEAVEQIEDCKGYRETPTVTWINVDGIQNVEILQRLGEFYQLHPLVVEDIANTTQRPKCEETDGYLFFVLKMLTYDDAADEIVGEQVSLVIGRKFVLSFQERVGDVFDEVRQRIRDDKGRVRKGGADYLAYALMDAVVDGYFTILEKLGDEIENMEEQLVGNPEPGTLKRIHHMKREMIFLRRCVWPLRETISTLQRGESALIQPETSLYLRDLYDHTIQVIDTIESMRDMVAGMIDLYLSSVSNRMNAVMKVLTIIATIFMPLTFIAGIYGMNFHYMPELNWPWAYPAVWLVMLGVAGLMVWFFRRRRWL